MLSVDKASVSSALRFKSGTLGMWCGGGLGIRGLETLSLLLLLWTLLLKKASVSGRAAAQVSSDH